jgi:GNAT superfamily N-acetyltransferase
VPTDANDVWPLARDFATSFTALRDSFDSAFTSLVARADTLLIVATRDGVLVGYLLASNHLTFLANGPVCWVEEVMVQGDQRRRGIGTSLMAEAERWAQDYGAPYVSLASRRASDFYLSLGYEESATYFKKTLV